MIDYQLSTILKRNIDTEKVISARKNENATARNVTTLETPRSALAIILVKEESKYDCKFTCIKMSTPLTIPLVKRW